MVGFALLSIVCLAAAFAGAMPSSRDKIRARYFSIALMQHDFGHSAYSG
jgi:hypothetical protein